MSCLSSDPPKIRLGVGGSGGSQEIRRPLQRSSVLDHDKWLKDKIPLFLTFLTPYSQVLWISDPLGLYPPGSLV